MESYIILKNLRFFAHHGAGAQEALIGNEFVLNMRLQADITLAAKSDDVAQTVNYADVYSTVKAEMEQPSRLLEHAGTRILKRLYHDYPAITAIDLELMKRNPPMGADIEAAGVEIHSKREDMV